MLAKNHSSGLPFHHRLLACAEILGHLVRGDAPRRQVRGAERVYRVRQVQRGNEGARGTAHAHARQRAVLAGLFGDRAAADHVAAHVGRVALLLVARRVDVLLDDQVAESRRHLLEHRGHLPEQRLSQPFAPRVPAVQPPPTPAARIRWHCCHAYTVWHPGGACPVRQRGNEPAPHRRGRSPPSTRVCAFWMSRMSSQPKYPTQQRWIAGSNAAERNTGASFSA